MKIFDCGGICPHIVKSWLPPWLKGINPSTKRRIIMRTYLIALFSLITMMHVSANVHAQKITLSIEKAPLKAVFKEIEKQSGFEVWYNNKLLENAKPVTIKLSGEMKTILDKIFTDQPLTYEIVDRTIVIKAKPVKVIEKKARPVKANKITGTITDEQGKGLSGVNVSLKGTVLSVTTNGNGSFEIDVPDENAILVFTYIGFQTVEQRVGNNTTLRIILKEGTTQLSEVEIINTGYQQLPKERVTGSFVHLNNTQLNRIVSTNIMERLNGMVSGLTYTDVSDLMVATTSPLVRNAGVQIRGTSTLSPFVSVSPLIVVDNFPYEGDLRNINPNDIESVTVLKDAAAASIWGARSGNGVIVITTKKGRLNAPLAVDVNSNVTVQRKPDVFYPRNFLSSADYIDAETKLFNAGYFDNALGDNFGFTPVSPVVDLLGRIRTSSSDSEKATLQAQIDALKNQDVRNDYDRYVYQSAVNQQYSIGVRGGDSRATYAFTAGYDQNDSGLKGNGFERLSLNSMNTYEVTSKLQISAGLNYSRSNTKMGSNDLSFTSTMPIGGSYFNLYPYARFADEQGNALAIVKDFPPGYKKQMEDDGFMDWQYRPLDELRLADNNTSVQNFIIKTSVNYKIASFLNAQLLYQNERQTIKNRIYRGPESYFTRNLINQFAILNPDGTFIYQVPNTGGVLNMGSYDWNSNNLRGQISFNRNFNLHEISAIAGGEIRQLRTTGFDRTSYGYIDQFGTSDNGLNFQDYLPVNPVGTAQIPASPGGITGVLNRFISYYTNLGYTYDKRYSLTLSGRRDGANLFGVKTNDKIVPLWSAGLGWSISNETFYHSGLIPSLKLRATYGFNGNVYYGSAYVTGVYLNSSTTGLPYIASLTAPNPRLRWEKVKNINIGLDFASKASVISGTIEYYRKDGQDLIEPVALAPSTGFSSFRGNAAATRTQGIDLTLKSLNYNRSFQWSTTLLLSTLHDKITKYDVVQSNNSISDQFYGAIGRPLFSVYSYRWAGLDPLTGDPQGYIDGQVSKDYTAISNRFDPDDLKFMGSAVPTLFGNFRNDFSYKGIGLSIGISYKLGYLFRRSSIGLSYSDMLAYGGNVDYSNRWQVPGDELKTEVPSLSLQDNPGRSRFYQYSEVLVEKGDHIRLQDIRLSYDVKLRKNPFKLIQLYAYVDKTLENDPPPPEQSDPLCQSKVIPFRQSKVIPLRQAKVTP